MNAPMYPPRDPLPTKEEIEAMTDEAALNEMLEGFQDRILRMEVDLQYRTADRDPAWELRACTALGYTKAAKEMVRRRIHVLFGGPRHAAAQAEWADRQAQRSLDQKALAAERAKAGVSKNQEWHANKLAKIEAQRFQKMHEIEAAKAKLARSHNHRFREAAKSMLDAETFARIDAAAIEQATP